VAALLATLATAPQAGLAQGKVAIGMPTAPPNIVHMPVYIAADLGYFKDEGLTPEFLSFEGGVYAFRAAVSGNVDVASASGPYSIVGRAQGAKTKLILANAPKLEATMTVQGNIKTLEDLRGKRIGIQEPGGFADVLSKMVLRSGGIKPDEVNFVSILSEDVPPLVAGQIDTAILHVEQFMVAKGRKSDLHVLAKLWEVAPLNLYNAYVVKEDFIAKRRQDAIGLTRAIIRGTRIMYSDKQKVMPSLVKHTGLDEKILSAAYDELVANCVWDANHGLSKERVNSTAQVMKKVGNIKGDVPSYEDLVDLSIPEAALKTLGPWKGPVCGG
jgi:ABC-type nitrate/sulfonate/bicarbonate transport system substrate-binding protein